MRCPKINPSPESSSQPQGKGIEEVQDLAFQLSLLSQQYLHLVRLLNARELPQLNCLRLYPADTSQSLAPISSEAPTPLHAPMSWTCISLMTKETKSSSTVA